VLGEVSRIFGKSAGHAAPLAALAEDNINDHLAELTAVEQPRSSDGADPKDQEIAVETAGDLFRALPALEQAPAPSHPDEAPSAQSVPDQAAGLDATDEPPPGVESENNSDARPAAASADPNLETDGSESADAQSPPASAAAESPVERPQALPSPPAIDSPNQPVHPSFAARVIPATRTTFESMRNIERRLPNRATLAAGLLVAALLGWISGAVFTRSAAVPAVIESPVAESPPEISPAEIAADKSKITGLEEQLQKALQDRKVAQHERDQARDRLERSAARLRTEQQSLAEQRAHAEASRKQVLDEFRRAEDRLHLTELRAYDAQLARVRDCWQRSPGLATALLEDQDGCPPKLRDFAWGYFYGRVKSDRATWAGSTPVNALSWSPDGKLLASAGQDGSITLRDAVSGKQIATLAAHAGGVSAVAFSQRGEWLASAGADSTVKLWDVASHRLEATFFGHLGTVLSVAMAPDSSALVSGGDDGTVKFWDVASRRAVATRWGHPRNHEPDDADDPSRFVRAVAFSPDGRLAASGCYRVVRIWDADAIEKTTLAVSDGGVNSLAFSPDGTTLAVGSEGSISLRDVDSLVMRSGPQPVAAPVSALSFSADGAWLAAATGENGLVFGRLARPAPDEPRKSLRAKADADRAGFDLANPLRLSGHNGPVTGIAFAPGGQLAATSGTDATVRLWNPQGGAVDKSRPDIVLRDIPRAAALAYSPDGRCLAVGTSDSIRLWNIRDGVEIARLANRSGDITCLAFSPDGELLASASRDWPILIWSVGAQRIKLALNGHTGGVNSLAYASDGKTLLSAGDDGTVRLWNTATGQAIASLSGHAGPVLNAILSADGRLAASGGADQKVRLWSVERKQTLATLAGHRAPVVALAFSPDGRFLVSAEGRPSVQGAESIVGAQRPLRLWGIPEGKEILTFGTKGDDVRDVAFSPDSRTLAASAPTGVTLWDPRTGEIRETLRFLSGPKGQLQRLGSAQSPASPVAFSPDGRMLAAGSDSALVIWTAAPLGSALGEKTVTAP
jgi:WD40 repeat protein